MAEDGAGRETETVKTVVLGKPCSAWFGLSWGVGVGDSSGMWPE